MHNYYTHVVEMMRELEYTIYSKDECDYLSSLIDNYSLNNLEDIIFKWNGKHANEFEDTNFPLREKLMFYYILNPPQNDNIVLLKDLFVEQCKYSNESWGAVEYLGIIGQMMLNKSLGSYTIDFIEYYGISMDTYASCSGITLTEHAKNAAVDKINNMINNKLFNKFSESKLKDDLEWMKKR